MEIEGKIKQPATWSVIRGPLKNGVRNARSCDDDHGKWEERCIRNKDMDGKICLRVKDTPLEETPYVQWSMEMWAGVYPTWI